MPDYYSELFADPSTPTVLDLQKRAQPGIGQGRRRYARAEITCDQAMAAGDFIVLKQLKSNDRLHAFFFQSTAGSEADENYRVDVGFYKSGLNHDPRDTLDSPAVAKDVLLDNFNLHVTGTSVARTDRFTQTDLDNFDRGKPLWQLANLGNGGSPEITNTSDPMENWDVVLELKTLSGTPNPAWRVVVEFEYTSGD